MKAIVFYFEPFGNDTVNSSEEAAKLVEPCIDDITIERHRLPVSFRRSVDTALETIGERNPHLIICLGQAAGRASINLERVAINAAHTVSRDADGYSPKNMPLDAEGPAACLTSLPVDDISESLRATGLPCFVSNSAGTYVCNCLYYHLLRTLSKIPVLFVHLPLTPAQAASRTSSTPSLSSRTAASAIHKIIRACRGTMDK